MESELLLNQPDTPAGCLNFCFLVYLNTAGSLHAALQAKGDEPALRFQKEVLASVTHTASMVMRLLRHVDSENELPEELGLVHQRLSEVFEELSEAFSFQELMGPRLSLNEMVEMEGQLKDAIERGE